jgi:hypothetical protein
VRQWFILPSRPQSVSENYDLLLTVEDLKITVDALTDNEVIADIPTPQLIAIETAR